MCLEAKATEQIKSKLKFFRFVNTIQLVPSVNSVWKAFMGTLEWVKQMIAKFVLVLCQ